MTRKISTNIDSLRVPRLISDGMVLQRETHVKIWGWAAAEKDVFVYFLNEAYSTKAAADGKWEIKLAGLKSGGPYNMIIKTDNSSIEIKDILIGDVWLCSGQSNMELPIRRVKDNYYDEIDVAHNSEIREFRIPMTYDFNTPLDDFEGGSWQEVNPDSILEFSATGYFFAQALYEKYHVPVGLINAAIGGSPVEAWISEEALQGFPQYLEAAGEFRDKKLISQILRRDEEISDNWYDSLKRQDRGLLQEELRWYDYPYDDLQWPSVNLPVRFEEMGLHNFNGVVWFRKEIYLSAEMAGKSARLWMGRIVDSDMAYVNGIAVGDTGYQYPPRKYNVPENILKEGKNVIAIRVISNNGHGEFIEDKPYRLFIGKEIVDLKGEWKYSVGAVTEQQLQQATFIQWKPLGLYNGMISPLIEYAIKGAIWYQGESNTSNPSEYGDLFTTLIKDWRQKWSRGDFPFLYVQLPNYLETVDEASKGRWPELREAQLSALRLPNTGMSVNIDIGEWNDLHPLNKKDIGKRLALLAQKIAYGENIVCEGPLYKSMSVEDNKIRIEFSNVGGGLAAKGAKELQHFAIAGEDREFFWAEVRIEGNTVVVWNENVVNPVAVRYAWTDNPWTANLSNKEGLLASPFRTDKW